MTELAREQIRFFGNRREKKGRRAGRVGAGVLQGVWMAWGTLTVVGVRTVWVVEGLGGCGGGGGGSFGGVNRVC